MSNPPPDLPRAEVPGPGGTVHLGEELLARQAALLEEVLPRVMQCLAVKPDPATTDLPLAQLRVCAALVGGDRTVSGLSREMGTSASAVTQLADRLEAAGMVERVCEGQDRRSRSLRLTPRGTAIMLSRRERRTARALQVLGAMDVQARALLLQSLEAMLEACSRAFAEPKAGAHEIITMQREP